MAIFETPAQADALCMLISVGFIAAAVPNYREPEDFPARSYARTSSKNKPISFITMFRKNKKKMPAI